MCAMSRLAVFRSPGVIGALATMRDSIAPTPPRARNRTRAIAAPAPGRRSGLHRYPVAASHRNGGRSYQPWLRTVRWKLNSDGALREKLRVEVLLPATEATV